MHTYIEQAATDQAVRVFEDLARSHAAYRDERANKFRRNAIDIRALFDRAALEPPGQLCELLPMRDVIRQAGESADVAMLALMDLMPYLTGVSGPYELEFHHNGNRIEARRSAAIGARGWDAAEFRDDLGRTISSEDILVKLRRRSQIVVRQGQT